MEGGSGFLLAPSAASHFISVDIPHKQSEQERSLFETLALSDCLLYGILTCKYKMAVKVIC